MTTPAAYPDLPAVTGLPRSTVQRLANRGEFLNSVRGTPSEGVTDQGREGKLLNMVSGQDPLPEQLLPSVQPPLREAEAPEYGIEHPPGEAERKRLEAAYRRGRRAMAQKAKENVKRLLAGRTDWTSPVNPGGAP